MSKINLLEIRPIRAIKQSLRLCQRNLKRVVSRKRRKILAVLLILLLLLTSLRLYFFLNPKEVRAATVELSTTSNTVQIDVANRYRAIIDTSEISDDFLVDFYDRAQNDSSPNRVLRLRPEMADPPNYYFIAKDENRITTILESTDTRVRVRVEGCYSTSTVCHSAGTGTITSTIDFTFTTEGMFVSEELDFPGGLTLGSGDRVAPLYLYFNTDVSTAHSETVLYGDGETAGTRGPGDGDGSLNAGADGYVVIQGTVDYQDIILGVMDLNGDKFLSNSSNAHDWYDIDESSEADAVSFYDDQPQTVTGIGNVQYFIQFHAQNKLNTEVEREALFNDLTNPDYLAHTTGDLWDNKPYGDFIFSSSFEGADSNLCDGGDGWSSGSCESGNTAVGNETAQVFDGNYAAKFTSTGTNDLARVSTSLGSTYNTLYVRLYFRLDYHDLGTWGEIGLIRLQDSVAWQDNRVLVQEDGGSGNLEIKVSDVNSSYKDTDHFIELDTWYSLEWKIYRHPSAGTADIWLDGAPIYSGTSLDTGDNDLDSLLVGLTGASSNNNQLLIDNVIVSKSYIGTAHYNEAEGAYTADMTVSDAEVNIDAGPSVSTLINDASVNAGDTTFTVDSTTGFPSSGVAYIEGDKFSYTGKTGTTFTGIPSSGELSIIGHADDSVVSSSRRHSPLNKFRNYRKNDVPQYVTLEQDTLTQGAEYNASVKPFTTSYFAQDLVWYSTLQSVSAVTSPNVGSAGAECGTAPTYPAGKYGDGALFDDEDECVYFPVTGGDSANFDKAKGAIEFWYQPENAHNDNNTHYFFVNYYDPNNVFEFYKSPGNYLMILVKASGTETKTTISSSNYSWSAGDWVHLRVEWDDTASVSEQFRIFVNGIEPTHDDDPESDDYISGNLTLGSNMGISTSGSGLYADGIIDEFRVYDFNGSGDQAELATLSVGGNGADSDEYLADPIDDYTFDFNNDDASNRGEYIWLGTDAPFGGVNMDLATDGVGSSEDFDWEYWNGTAWSALTVTDQDTGAHSFTADGNFYFTPPADWFPYSVNSSTDLYYIRGHLEDGSYSTDPIENRIQTDILLIHYQDNIVDENQTLFVPAITAGSNPPVVYWNLDEGYGTTANDASGHGNAGTITGAAWQSEDLCYSGKCLYFDGSDDEISRTDDPQFDSDEAGSFSISAWIRHPDISTNPDVIAAKFESTGGDGGYRLQMESDGDISFGIDTDNSSFPEDSVTSTSANFDDNHWHHVTAVKDANDNLYLYIDGNLIDTDATISATDSLDNDDAFYLGIDGDGSSNPWAGFIDEFKFYRYARSADEIKTDFQHNSAVRGTSASFSDDKSFLSDGLVGYWKMDENTGQYIYDSSGSSISGTLGADASSGSDDMTWDSGKYGSALTSDGVEDYAKIPDNDLLDVQIGDMTVSAWFITNGDHNTYIVTKDNCGNTNDWLIGVEANGQTSFRLIGDTSVAISHGSSSTLNQWHHVVGVKNGTTMQIYFDGVIKNSATAPTGLAGNSQDVYIGARGGSISNPESCSYPIPGSVDEVRIYNRALTPSEVEGLYHWAPGPVGYWPMDEASWTNDCSTDTVFDHSGNANHGDACPSSTGPTGGAPGKFGKAGDFDGSNDYVSTSLAPPTAGTISVWFKSSVMPPDDIKMMVGNVTYGTPTKRSYLGITTGSKLGGGLGDNNVAGATTLVANTWYHGVITWDGTTNKLFLNGVQDFTGAQSGTVAVNTFLLGAGNSNTTPTWHFPGLIDDIRIYNYARTQEQIIEDMNAGHPVGGSPLPSQVGYWAFDEGYGDTANDSGIGDNDGNLEGTCPGASSCPTWTPSGKFDKALSFDGTDEYVTLPNESDFDFTGAMSVTAWIKVNAFDIQWQTLIAKGDSAWRISRYSNNNTLEWTTNGLSDAVLDGTTDVSDGSWYHVAGVYDGSSTKYLYINGVVDAIDTGLTGSISTNDYAVWIGNNSQQTSRYWEGLIDEVKIYNTALTADQVKLDMNQGKAAVWGASSTDSSGVGTWSAQNEYCPSGQGSSCTAPVAEWKFDEKAFNTCPSSADVCDLSGNENHGEENGSMTSEDWVPGKYGRALDFDGSDDNIEVTDNNAFSITTTNELTVEAWVNPHNVNPASLEYFIRKGEGSNYEWYMDIDTGSEFVANINNPSGTNYLTAGSGVTATAGQWYHVAFTVDTTAPYLKIYVNGVEGGEDTTTSGSIANGTASVIIGGASSGTKYDGLLDNVRIYNYARAPAQIAWDYNRGAPVGYWQLDECSGTTAYDASGNGNNGTITIGSSGSNTSAGTCTGSSSEAWYNGATGKRNASLDFDGTDDYVTLPDDSDIHQTSNFTVSGWIRPSSDVANYMILADSSPADCESATKGYSIWLWGGKIDICMSGIDAAANFTYAANEWAFFTVVHDGTDIVIYKNGKYDDSWTNAAPTVNDTAIRIGKSLNGGGYYFDGQIDDVKTFNYALTEEQIRNEYNQGAVFFGPSEGSP